MIQNFSNRFETITPKGRPPEPIEVGILRIKQKK